MKSKNISILGIRGIPARHGGFETFAERLALYLIARDWHVTVYCQENGTGKLHVDEWNGIQRVIVPVRRTGALGTIQFDWRCIVHFLKAKDGVVLTLGYNTAIFEILLRICRVVNIINMDGLEWKRQKWHWYEKAWLWLNERIATKVANHLIADHPCIAQRLESIVSPAKISTIAYGADTILSAPSDHIKSLGLDSGEYAVVIARAEPENSLLEIVKAFSMRPRGIKLVILGDYKPDTNKYHGQVLACASQEVVFTGSIYDENTVKALRFHALLYLHGHQVGGTNPSLVEALAAGPMVAAHDNPFNRWVAGDGAAYFGNTMECAKIFDGLQQIKRSAALVRESNQRRHSEKFKWEDILEAYEQIIMKKSPNGKKKSQVQVGKFKVD